MPAGVQGPGACAAGEEQGRGKAEGGQHQALACPHPLRKQKSMQRKQDVAWKSAALLAG